MMARDHQTPAVRLMFWSQEEYRSTSVPGKHQLMGLLNTLADSKLIEDVDNGKSG